MTTIEMNRVKEKSHLWVAYYTELVALLGSAVQAEIKDHSKARPLSKYVF